MMELLLYLYILIVVYLFLKYSRIRTLYIFSPYILIYLNFIFNDAIPFLFFYPDVPENIQYTTFTAAIINLSFLFLFRKQAQVPISINLPLSSIKLNKKRKILLSCFVFFLLWAGVMSGVLINLLRGNNIEDLRRTSEIGVGVIRDIPMLGIQIIMLVLFLQKTWKCYYKVVAFYSFCLSVLLYLL